MPEHRTLPSYTGWARDYAWFVALSWGAFLGIAEGTQWHAFGRADPWVYWTLLVILMFAPIAVAIGPFHALAWMPVTILVQDLFSLLAQHEEPWAATWYATFFPWLGPLAYPNGAFPKWYVVAWVLSFVLVLAANLVDHQLSRRRAQGSRE